MPVYTTLKSSKILNSETVVRDVSLISGQTFNTANFTELGGHSAYGGLATSSTSRSVDGGATGTSWGWYYLRSSWVGNYATPAAILIDDLLLNNQEIEISGYFFRGKAAQSADVPSAAGYEAEADTDFLEIVYEDNSDKISDFSSYPNGGDASLKYVHDYVSAFDADARWTNFTGQGPIPLFNGHNIGTKGGWEHSTGRSDFNFAQCVSSDGGTESLQRDSKLYFVNLEEDEGLSRFFRIVIKNASGKSAKLKLRFHNTSSKNSAVGFYDLKARVTTIAGHGLYTDNKLHLGLGADGRLEPGGATTKYRNIGAPVNDGDLISRSTFLTDTISNNSSSTYSIYHPINCQVASTGNRALPLACLEPVTKITGDIRIGGTTSFAGDTGTYTLGPMPGAGSITKLKWQSSTTTAYNSVSVSILKITAAPGTDDWDYGSGEETIISSASPANNGDSTIKTWTWSSGNAFNADDILLVLVNFTATQGYINGYLEIKHNLSTYD